MPALRNQKHEAFVQGLLKGMTADAAYEAAGYKPNRFNASRLKTSENIKRRLEELQNLVTERVVEAVKIERQWVVEALIENAEIALGRRKTKFTRKLKDMEFSVEFEEYDRDAAAANAALKLLGQLPEVGLFKEEGGDVNVNVNNMAAPQATGEDHLADVARRYGAPPKLVIDNAKKASGP